MVVTLTHEETKVVEAPTSAERIALRDLPVAVISVDERYQRALNRRFIRERKGKYDPALVGRLVVSARPDGFFIIDGQHRIELARQDGIPVVPTEIHAGLTVAQEARLFHSLDTERRGLSSVDDFRALLVADDPDARAIAAILDKHNVTMGLHSGSYAGFRAYRSALDMVRKHGLSAFDGAIAVLVKAWPPRETDTLHRGTNAQRALNNILLRGMAEFLRTFPDIDRDALAEKLGSMTSPEKLIIDARAISGSLTYGSESSCAQAILNLWNWRRSAGRLSSKWLRG